MAAGKVSKKKKERDVETEVGKKGGQRSDDLGWVPGGRSSLFPKSLYWTSRQLLEAVFTDTLSCVCVVCVCVCVCVWCLSQSRKTLLSLGKKE